LNRCEQTRRTGYQESRLDIKELSLYGRLNYNGLDAKLHLTFWGNSKSASEYCNKRPALDSVLSTELGTGSESITEKVTEHTEGRFSMIAFAIKCRICFWELENELDHALVCVYRDSPINGVLLDALECPGSMGQSSLGHSRQSLYLPLKPVASVAMMFRHFGSIAMTKSWNRCHIRSQRWLRLYLIRTVWSGIVLIEKTDRSLA
jgi:hypothetical protein